MKVLFVHQNFPGQFRSLAPALVARGDTVLAMGVNNFAGYPGIRYVQCRPDRNTMTDGHPWTKDFDSKVIRGHAAFRAALNLRNEGFDPDVIIAHPGWGEALFLKSVWPEARLGIYCEYFYSADGADMQFDAEFPSGSVEENRSRLLVKNAANLLQMPQASAAIAPTRWQADTFPEEFRDRISVIHDGIDTSLVKPNPAAGIQLNKRVNLTRSDEVITFVNRNLEPYRGYHVFMRALPELLARRPNAHVIIIGGDDVSYGAAPPAGHSWKNIFLREVSGRIDAQRVHFLGKVPYKDYLAVLCTSAVHVYLTYPFVLSWSLIESMAMECAIVASDTEPVREVLSDGEQGILVPFFDGRKLVDEVCGLLDNPEKRRSLGQAARSRAIAEFDLRSVCLPQQLGWVDKLFAAD
ncbi:glycosyltransferase family 4 protein [Novosphingobium aquae]|uniref:Glycosyltransferase family 4 protein n=1 Tax=Novosphingobium aquae TaxID=3133435 RepID=A0ABU8S9D7_9SPHN